MRSGSVKESWGPPEIKPSEIQRIQVLGDGSFGTVYRGTCRQKDVAVKVLHKQNLDPQTLKAFRQEVEIMSKIFHPNVVLFMGACTVPGSMMIVTELLKNGDMETMLQDEKINLPLLTRFTMARDAALGMTWLHNSNPIIIHRDLKTANLLVDDSFNVKVCDFGLSEIKQKGQESLKDGKDGAKGTPLWMAPEVMMGQPFNEKADIYSFGIVLWEILKRKEPFSQFTQYEQFREAVCFDHVRPEIPADCPPRLKMLMKACWQPDPTSRPSFEVIVNELNELILELAIADHYGRKLWRDWFPQRLSIPWEEFEEAFKQLLGWSKQVIAAKNKKKLPEQPTAEELADATKVQLDEWAALSEENKQTVKEEYAKRPHLLEFANTSDDDIPFNLRCLKMVLAEKPKNVGGLNIESNDEVVSMENWGKILSWFGPLVVRGSGIILLEKLRSLLSNVWFHGNISTPEAESRLSGKGAGTFLIRFSTSSPGAFTISKVAPNKSINHQRIIYRVGRGFELGNNVVYHSLDDLVKGQSKELNLLTSCPGSYLYAQLFSPQVSAGYIANP